MTVFAIGSLFAAGQAFASNFTYSTSGIFSSSNSNTLTGTNETLTFTGVPNTLSNGMDSTPASDNLGIFSVNIPNSQQASSLTIPNGEQFMLTINQIDPVGTGTLSSADFTGTVSQNPPDNRSGMFTLTFQNTSVTLGGITYTITNVNDLNQLIVGTQGTAIAATEMSATPEPALYGLTGSGFIGLVAMAIRRKKQNTEVKSEEMSIELDGLLS